MKYFGFAWRALLVLATFLSVGLWVEAVVVRVGQAGNAPIAQVRLSSAMAGLFAGGAAAALMLLLVTLWRRKGRKDR